MRRAAKRDQSEPEIVKALEAIGCLVYRSLPCDLLVHRPADGPGVFRALECKTPLKRGGIKSRKDQPEQDAFLELTGTPRVTTPEQAIEALCQGRQETHR